MRQLPEYTGFPLKILGRGAEELDVPDASFDAVVATLVLCSVKDPERAMAEIKRVLRPGGSLVFREHVAAEHDPPLWRRQRMVEPFWKFPAGNCHLTRRTASLIEAAGFRLTHLERVQMAGAPSLVRNAIRGRAQKPNRRAT